MSLAVCELPPVYILGDMLGESAGARAWRDLLPRLVDRGLVAEARRFWPVASTNRPGASARTIDLAAGSRRFTVSTLASDAHVRLVESAASRRVPLGSQVLTMDPELAPHAKLLVPEGGKLLLLRPDDAMANGTDYADRLCARPGEGVASHEAAIGAHTRRILLTAPVLGPSGYAAEGRALFDFFERDPAVHVALRPLRFGRLDCAEDEEFLRRVRDASLRTLDGPYEAVHLVFPPQFAPDPNASRNILRTMYETDDVPESWIEGIRQADELWVPSGFHLRSFGRHFDRDRIRIVPELIDPAYFAPRNPTAPGGPTRFLSMFDWSERKAPELLLDTFGATFRQGEAELVLKISSSAGVDANTLRARALAHVAAGARRSEHEAPTLRFLPESLAPSEMPHVYRDVDAFVSTSRGEGWGRPIHEAMASSLPVIATAFGGSQDLVGEPGTAFVIAGRSVPVSDEAVLDNPALAPHHGRQQEWFEPCPIDLARHMRTVHEHPEIARGRGIAARQHVERSFKNLETKAAITATARRARVVFEGPLLGSSSYARITRAIAARLASELEIGLRETSASPEPQLAGRDVDEALPANLHARVIAKSTERHDVVIRSGWPISSVPPNARRWIQRVDWEYGSLPVDVATTLSHGPDEIWVHSSHVLRAVLAAGIERDKVHVLPHGIDPSREHPDAVPLDELRARIGGRFAFLFVGSTIPRKGFDVLLETWIRTFRATDPVCLVIKSADHSAAYAGKGNAPLLEQARTTPGVAEILTVDRDLSDSEMASLYASCDCLVHPFRGEGFGMPLLEARACGLPILFTAGGAPDDFLGSEGSLRIASTRVSVRMPERCVATPWLLEPDANALQAAFKNALRDRDRLRTEARYDARRVHADYSWEVCARRVAQRIEEAR